jgi:hypothetical protein
MHSLHRDGRALAVGACPDRSSLGVVGRLTDSPRFVRGS